MKADIHEKAIPLKADHTKAGPLNVYHNIIPKKAVLLNADYVKKAVLLNADYIKNAATFFQNADIRKNDGAVILLNAEEFVHLNVLSIEHQKKWSL